MRKTLLSLSILIAIPAISDRSLADMFPFQLPWDDSSHTLTDFSFLNPKPAGVMGPLRAGPAGHLFSGSQRVRLLGVNFTYRSTMPVHADAQRIARRLAKFGINIVRFHLMDANWDGECIFDPAYPDTRHLNPAALDKLDYFIAALKENGIYTDLNLLTGRNFRSADDLDEAINGMDWKEKQTPAFFDPQMILLQKEYATQLLDRTNRYTGLAYRADPALAIVEVVNEHGLLHAWRDGQIDTLPGYFSTQLKQMWNEFLRAKYGSQSRLQEAWTSTTPPGTQLLLNPDFSAQLQHWNVEQHAGATVSAVVSSEGPSGVLSARLRVTSTSNIDWHIQLNQEELNLIAGTNYTLSFWAKADRAKTIQTVIEQAHEPWSELGFSKTLPLTTNWQKFSFVLSLTASDNNARLNFRGLCDQLATYWFSGLSLSPGGTLGLFPEENLDDVNIRLLFKSELDQRREIAKQDFSQFLWEKEESYWLGMRSHLKETLGLRALVMGTIVGTSTPNLMSVFDIVDSHAYWQHPAFEQSWGSPWWITNSSMLGENGGGTLTGLAVKRVHGKPFSVSEYNHPFPNSFGVEGFLLLAAYGALQDWDALFAYTYADGTLNWSENRQNGYFDLHHDPGKMIILAHAAAIFRRGDVAAAQHLVSVRLTKNDEIDALPAAYSWRLVDAELKGLAPPLALLHRTSLAIEGEGLPTGAWTPSAIPLPTNGHFRSDTSELDWNMTTRILQINTRRSKGLVGYVVNTSFDLDRVVFRPLSSLQNWAAIMLTEVPGSPRPPRVRKYLLSALGLVQNTQLEWRYYPGGESAGFPPPADVDLTLGSWGDSPVQVEGIQCELVLPYAPSRVEVYALDNTGAHKNKVPVGEEAGAARFRISEAYQTLWYEVLVQPLTDRIPIRRPEKVVRRFFGGQKRDLSDNKSSVVSSPR